jgi:hypothetical protein
MTNIGASQCTFLPKSPDRDTSSQVGSMYFNNPSILDTIDLPNYTQDQEAPPLVDMDLYRELQKE